jgi:hypothetical protein
MGCSAVGNVIGSGINAYSAGQAAKTQAESAKYAANLQLQEQNQVRGDLAPYNQNGQAASNELSSFFTPGFQAGMSPNPLATSTPAPSNNAFTSPQTGNGTAVLGNTLGDTGQPSAGGAPSTGVPASGAATAPNSELSALENTPGYQFALTQGLESTQNGLAARGLGISGAALKGAASYAEGLAQNTYQTNLLQPLQSLAAQGEAAAAQTGAQGTVGAANAGAGIIGAGNASAAGIVGAGNAIAGAFGSAGNAPLNYQLYSQLTNNGGALSGKGGNDSGSISGGGTGYAPGYSAGVGGAAVA